MRMIIHLFFSSSHVLFNLSNGIPSDHLCAIVFVNRRNTFPLSIIHSFWDIRIPCETETMAIFQVKSIQLRSIPFLFLPLHPSNPESYSNEIESVSSFYYLIRFHAYISVLLLFFSSSHYNYLSSSSVQIPLWTMVSVCHLMVLLSLFLLSSIL